MSQKQEHINIKITLDELKLSLQKLIKSEHSFLIAEIIIDNLNRSEVGLEQFYKSLFGIKVVPKFKILDDVYAKWDYLGTWRLNKFLMQKHKMLFKDCVKAKIIEIDIYKILSINIEFTGRDVDEEPKVHTVWISEHHITSMEDFIDKNFIDESDVPF